MATKYERLEAWWERRYPLILGVFSAVIAAVEAPHGFHLMDKLQWKWDSIYGTTFNLAAVTTPFIFTFYTIFVTTDVGFIGRMKNTNAYRYTLRYTGSAMWSGALLIATSLPLTVIAPKPSGHADPWTYVVAVWIGILSITLLSFLRAVRMFQIFIGIQKVFKPRAT